MKTILIPIYQAVEVKNILRTDIIKKLLERPDIRVVCLVRNTERIGYYRKEIPYERISYDVFSDAPRGMAERFFSMVKFHFIRTQTTELKRRLRYKSYGGFAKFKLGLAISRLLSRRRVRAVLRFFDYHLVRDSGYIPLLKKYQPDTVFLAHLFDDAQVALLREAQKIGIPTIGFINSWDKLTARCGLRLLPDTLIVYNNMAKQEAIAHADMPENRIRVCGIPQYDQYITEKPRLREEFFKKIGLDPARPMVLYAPYGETLSGSDWEMIDLFHSLTESGAMNTSAQLFVRFQPNDFITESELAKRSWLVYDRPGIRYGTERGGDWDMTFADLSHLHDTLAHAAVLVCHPSSLSIDAAVTGTPVINVDFEIKPTHDLMKAPTRFYVMEHYRKALETGGICMVKNVEDMTKWINAYIRNPLLDAEGRKSLVRQQLPHADGKSGARIAAVILDAVNPALARKSGVKR